MKKFLLAISFSLVLLFSPTIVKAQTTDDTCPGGLITKEAARLFCETNDKAKEAFPDPETCQQLACYILSGFEKKSNPSPWYAQTPQEFSTKVLAPGDEIFGERYTYAQINWIINSLITMMNPVAGAQKPEDVFLFFDTIKKFLSYNPANPPTNSDYARLGIFGFIGQVVEQPYFHPIASGIQETKELASKVLDIGVQPAYAQGIGFSKLGTGNVKTLWTATRNISYLVAIILLIASGFLVMFRTQIAPQTIVTVQMIIPKLAISLLLITFSYAIVGFVIDIIYVTIIAFLGLLSITGSPSLYVTGGLTTAINGLVAGDFRFVQHFLWLPIGISLVLLALIIIGPIVLSLIIPVIGSLIAASALPLVIMVFGLFAWSLYVWARIVGQLFLAYLNLALLTISGPLQIMADIIPSKKGIGFVPWIKCVIGNASVFVSYAVLAIIATALFRFDFLNAAAVGGLGFDTTHTLLNPNFTLPLADFSALGTRGVGGLIFNLLLAMGYFTAVPNIVASIRDLFCKGEDYSKFIEGLVKDTVGSITKAGQGSTEGLGKLQQQLKPLPNTPVQVRNP